MGKNSNLQTHEIGGSPLGEKTDRFVGLTGAQIFNEMMHEHQVDLIFGYPGGAILPVFDAIHESPYFKFILTRHEQGAGHMAEGYARISGKPGVVLVTSGPGATNTITPMQDALMDGTPMVVFTGNGHIVNKFGIPDRVKRRTDIPMATIAVYPLTEQLNIDREMADYLWLTGSCSSRTHPFMRK